MKYLKQFLIILAVSFAGEILHLLPLPVPASIYGIILMFLLLKTGVLPLSAVKETGMFLVEIMPVMFIPAAVGLLDVWGIIVPSLLSYALVTLMSTVAVMSVAALVTQAVIRRQKKEGKE